MGMYTELNINVELKDDTPKEVIEILKYMLDNNLTKPELLSHDLFYTDRWEHMLKGDSYYFDADTHSTLRYGEICESWYLNIQCNLKNYDNEIDKFINFITPYVDTDGFWGYKRYEEDDDPTLIYDGSFRTVS